MGRPRKLTPVQVAELVSKMDQRRAWTNTRLAIEYGVSETTLVNAYQRAKGWTRRRDADADAGD